MLKQLGLEDFVGVAGCCESLHVLPEGQTVTDGAGGVLEGTLVVLAPVNRNNTEAGRVCGRQMKSCKKEVKLGIDNLKMEQSVHCRLKVATTAVELRLKAPARCPAKHLKHTHQ